MLTVITPAATSALTTLDAVKAELKVVGNGDDGWLSAVIGRASAAVRSFCRRPFGAETVREVLHLSAPAEALALERWPLLSIASVTEGGKALTGSDFEAESETGLVYRLASGTRRNWLAGRIEVEYRAGYVLPGENGRTLPEDIEHAVILLVMGQWHARGRDPAVKSESVEGVGRWDFWISDTGKLPSDVVALLSPHRQSLMG